MDSSNQFSTSSLVTGKIYASDYTIPTPSAMTTAISDMETAYADITGRTETNIVTELGAGDISGMTLTPGLYKWSTSVLINTGVTLNCQGNANSIFIFQISQDLTLGNGAIITLSNSCQAKNIFWQVGGQATLGTTSVFNGNILSKTLIEINTGAVLNGRALAQTAVTLDANAITVPVTTITPIIPVITPLPNTTLNNSITTTTNENSETHESNKNIQENLNSEEIKLETELPIKVEGNAIHITQSNGINTDVKIMPSTASETALARLRLKVCNETNNCTIILKEIGTGTNIKLVYQMKAQKNVKVLGLFKAKMNIETNVDAETGKIISTKMPWWHLISITA